MNLIKGIMTAAVAAISISASTTALAGDGKSLPGTFCQAESTGVHLTYEWNARASNSTSSTMWVTCPVVRDIMGNAINKASMRVYDQSYNQNISCQLHSRSSTGHSGWYSTKTTSGSDTSSKKLSWGALSAYDYGIYFFRCSLPATYSGNRSRIASYYTEE